MSRPVDIAVPGRRNLIAPAVAAILAAAMASALSQPAGAAEPGDAADADNLSELVVTGSRITRRDYEGAISTLCAGCGHDSISAAIVRACFELSLPPHRIAKLSGIGCSSKTPTYFLGNSHGFNSVHGRMPSVLTGAYLAKGGLAEVSDGKEDQRIALCRFTAENLLAETAALKDRVVNGADSLAVARAVLA